MQQLESGIFSRQTKNNKKLCFFLNKEEESHYLISALFQSSYNLYLLTGVCHSKTVGCLNVVHMRYQIERSFGGIGAGVMKKDCQSKSSVFLVCVSDEETTCERQQLHTLFPVLDVARAPGLPNISNSKHTQLRSSVAIPQGLLLSLHCMLNVLVFRAAQLFLASICYGHNDL